MTPAKVIRYEVRYQPSPQTYSSFGTAKTLREARSLRARVRRQQGWHWRLLNIQIFRTVTTYQPVR